MAKLKPAPEGQPTSGIKRYLKHAKSDLAAWESELAYIKRQLAIAERAIARETENVKLFEYQLQLRQAQGRDD